MRLRNRNSCTLLEPKGGSPLQAQSRKSRPPKPEAPPTGRALSNQRLQLLAPAPPPWRTCSAPPPGLCPIASAITGASNASASRLRWMRPMEARFSRSATGSPAPQRPGGEETPPAE